MNTRIGIMIFSIATFVLLESKAQVNSFPSSGNVGIGTMYKYAPLSIGSSDDAPALISLNRAVTGPQKIVGGIASGIGPWWTDINTTSLSEIQFITGSSFYRGEISFLTNGSDATANKAIERMRISETGKIGIGTISPDGVLHIHNNVTYANNATNHLVLSNGGYRNTESGGLNSDNAGISFYMTNYNAGGKHYDRSLDIRMRGAGDGSYGASMIRFFASDYTYAADEQERMRIHGNGNVGIGITNPTEKLSVNGNVRAKKVIVTQTGWPDHVFGDGYKLRSLADLSKFIIDNKHLPEMPSAEQVAEKGLNLGENQALLLKKIEELTLYILAQQKEIDLLKKQVKEKY